jgi:ssDNA-binding Zn-finger/Zn-ribbon topoisomerase 1
MELEEHEVRLRTGTCPTCAKEFAFVEGTAVAARLGAPPLAAIAGSEEGEATGEKMAGEGPECKECGSPLTFREGRGGTIEASCPDCETTTVLVRKREAAREERGERPRDRFDAGAPRARPCRQCGAPLRFSTDEDGQVVGECTACGNRFTLPPRSESGGGRRDYRGRPSFQRRDFRGGPPRRPYSSDRRERFGGTDDERRRRRRPRDE